MGLGPCSASAQMATSPSPAEACAGWASEGRGSCSGPASGSYQATHPEQQQAPHLHHRQQQEARMHYTWPVLPPPLPPTLPGAPLHHVSTQTGDEFHCRGQTHPSPVSVSPRAMELNDGRAPAPSCATVHGGQPSLPNCYGGLVPPLYGAGDEGPTEMVLLSPSTLARPDAEDATAQSPFVAGGGQQGCPGEHSAILQRLIASCDPHAEYALLGPVSCSELYILANLLRRDLCRVRWLYLAVQDPYRKGEFSQRATHAIADLADALASNKRLQGLILRMPQSELGNQQLTRILGAFTQALHSNRCLTSLQFKPPGFFCNKGTNFEPLVKAGRLPEACCTAFLSGTHSRLGADSPISTLPREVLMRILDHCHCSVG